MINIFEVQVGDRLTMTVTVEEVKPSFGLIKVRAQGTFAPILKSREAEGDFLSLSRFDEHHPKPQPKNSDTAVKGEFYCKPGSTARIRYNGMIDGWAIMSRLEGTKQPYSLTKDAFNSYEKAEQQ